MNVSYSFGYKDPKYQDTVKGVVESLIPVVEELFSTFEVSLDDVQYKSDNRDCEIRFESTAKKFYPAITITMQPIISLDDGESTNTLLFSATFSASGISRETFHSMVSELEGGPVQSFSSYDKKIPIPKKMKNVINQAEKTFDSWRSYVAMRDIFLF